MTNPTFPHKTFYQGKIFVWESCLYRTTTSLIDLGDALLLVDPNWLPKEVDKIREFINTHFSDKEIYILFTHSDFDHVIGYGAFPEAKTIASNTFSKPENASKALDQIREFDSQYYITRPYPVVFPHVDITILEDGQTLKMGQTKVYFYHAPGHTEDSLWAIIPDLPTGESNHTTGLWIAGDYMSNVEIPWIDYDAECYEKSLEKATSILDSFPSIELMIPGHGDPAISREEIKIRIRKDIQYLSKLAELKSLIDKRRCQASIDEFLLHYPFPAEMQKIHSQNLHK